MKLINQPIEETVEEREPNIASEARLTNDAPLSVVALAVVESFWVGRGCCGWRASAGIRVALCGRFVAGLAWLLWLLMVVVVVVVLSIGRRRWRSVLEAIAVVPVLDGGTDGLLQGVRR